MEIPINEIMEILAYFMLITGLMVSLSRTIQRMILYYQCECIFLAAITFLTALDAEKSQNGWVAGLFVVIPILLALLVKPLLAQATVLENVSVWRRLYRWYQWLARRGPHNPVPAAWLQSRRARPGILLLLMIDLVIVVFAFVTAYRITAAGWGQSQSLALAVSFSLLLFGLSIMITAEEIISQVTGLLVMEQGMFLAAVRCIQSSELRTGFILGLFLYTTITLTLLVILLPELHQKSGSLDIDQQAQLKG